MPPISHLPAEVRASTLRDDEPTQAGRSAENRLHDQLSSLRMINVQDHYAAASPYPRRFPSIKTTIGASSNSMKEFGNVCTEGRIGEAMLNSNTEQPA
jgi:hypothetical protein